MNGSERNTIIDGWRGLSVLLVIIGHLLFYRFDSLWPIIHLNYQIHSNISSLHKLYFVLIFIAQRILSHLATLGVDIFFMISGFLITSILIKEEELHGRISIRAFYVRRILRIAPAFYSFVLVIFVLWLVGIVKLPSGAFLQSSLYLCNISGENCSWWFGHTWSLAVEEQFYLVWPAIFLLGMTLRKTAIIALSAVLPFTAAFLPYFEGFSFIAFGALVGSVQSFKTIIEKYSTSNVLAVLLIILFIIVFFDTNLQPWVKIMQPLLVGFILFGTLVRRGPVLPIVSTIVIQRIGIISYSLYLWQQLSLAPTTWLGMDTGAELYLQRSLWSVPLFILPALIVYYFVERPFIAFGQLCSKRIIMKSGTVRNSAVGNLYSDNSFV